MSASVIPPQGIGLPGMDGDDSITSMDDAYQQSQQSRKAQMLAKIAQAGGAAQKIGQQMQAKKQPGGVASAGQPGAVVAAAKPDWMGSVAQNKPSGQY
jgi:hypothetical protein